MSGGQSGHGKLGFLLQCGEVKTDHASALTECRNVGGALQIGPILTIFLVANDQTTLIKLRKCKFARNNTGCLPLNTLLT